MIEAEVQKKLMKASKFFSGKLTQNLGLRYAPDLRFHLDNTQTQLKDVYESAQGHLKEFD